MAHEQHRIRPKNETHKVLRDFEIQSSARRPVQVIVKIKKEKKRKRKKDKRKMRTSRIGDLAVPADCRVKLKEGKKRGKYIDLVRELKKLWNVKVTVIPIITGVLSTVTRGLVQGLEDLKIRGGVETIQIIELLRSARILRRVQETRGDLLSLKLQGETISLSWCEKFSKENNDNIQHC